MATLNLTETELECLLISLGEGRKLGLDLSIPDGGRQRAWASLREKAWKMLEAIRAWRG